MSEEWGGVGDIYYVFARHFGMTPGEVDKLPRGLVVYMLSKLRKELEHALAVGRTF